MKSFQRWDWERKRWVIDWEPVGSVVLMAGLVIALLVLVLFWPWSWRQG